MKIIVESHSILYSFFIYCFLPVIFFGVANAVLVTEDNVKFCQVFGSALQCDFGFSVMDVRVDNSVNKFKTVFVTNTHQLLLHADICASVSLYHITSVIYISSSSTRNPVNEDCKEKALHLHNATIDHIPPYLRTLSMENSRLMETFTHQPSLKKIKVVNSYIKQLNIDSPVRGDGEVRLHSSNISSLAKIRMTDNSKFFLTDSVVEIFDLQSIILNHNSSAEIMRTTFLQRQEATIIHEEDARIIMANITGLFSVSYRGRNIDPACNVPSKKTWTLGVIIVTLLVLLAASITMNMFVVWLLRRNRSDERDIISKTQKKTRIVRDIQDEEEGIRQTKIVLLSNNIDSF